MCALRGRQSGQPNVRAVLRHFVPNKGLHPLRRLRVYPSTLCSGNRLLAQTISAAKPENPISLPRPSTENVGGLFVSIFISVRRLKSCTKKKLRSCKQRKKRSSGSLRRSSTKFSGSKTVPPTTERENGASGRTGLSPAVQPLRASLRRRKSWAKPSFMLLPNRSLR